ncbi:MAG: pantoate--beta-alanine ligase [Desulfurella sp.]|uniref:Pantothenate synthetase n=2 Tax=Desulfurella multipotens TaxID=79269 RepID=A0A1G6R292_9BACT|nr:pantoate--beta-alanine ligase [Desulfurella multipotens]SDC98137.1 pantoate--beta-alanine ligase [Desulfurella multipotens]
MSEVIHTIEQMKEFSKKAILAQKSIGFVPTMGYLHEGHLSLIQKARSQNDIVVVSIFVNPLQFAPNEDFNTYPRDFEKDRILCEQNGVDVIFYPGYEEMYPQSYQTYVEVSFLSKPLEGKSRPTHFKGVTTIVLKLFNIVKPTRAYFGKKDAQQLIIIKKMVEDLNLDVEIVPCEIKRDADGLALSSRNVYLNAKERSQAICLKKALDKAKELIDAKIYDSQTIIQNMKNVINSYDLARIDYISINSTDCLSELKEVVLGKTLISLAVFFGKTRLIDNMWI